MKHFVNGILMLLWAAGMIVMAQTPTSRVGTSYGSVAVPGFLPPAIGQSAVAYWTSNLGLDAGQQASVKTILADQEGATNALKSSLDQALATLTAAAKANSVDSQIDRLSAELAAIFAQAVAVQAKAYARFYALLTPDQKQRFDKLTELPPGALFSAFGSVGGPVVTSVKH